jgi:hypothetical protein
MCGLMCVWCGGGEAEGDESLTHCGESLTAPLELSLSTSDSSDESSLPSLSLFRHDEWRMPCYGRNATVGIDHIICILSLLNT